MLQSIKKHYQISLESPHANVLNSLFLSTLLFKQKYKTANNMYLPGDQIDYALNNCGRTDTTRIYGVLTYI